MNKLDALTLIMIGGAAFVAYTYYQRQQSQPKTLTMSGLLTRPQDYWGKRVTVDGVTGIFV